MRHFKISSLILTCVLFLSNNAHADERPLGGWRYLPSDEADFVSEYNYYGHPFKTEKSTRAMIMGKIKTTPHQKPKQATLVANGVAMPLRIDEAGNYARPYAFGAGSNSIQIKNAEGEIIRRSQFFEANNGKAPAKLRVVFITDAVEQDIIDLHVVTPNGEHAWYGQRVIPSGGAIDQDAANDGSAPQIFATRNGMRGLYQVYINYYYNSGKKDHVSGRITVITDENTPQEKQQSFSVQLLKEGELMLAKSFLY